MSVYIRKGRDDPRFWYDFVVAGQRFLGCTGKTTRREAEREEQCLKDEAKLAAKTAKEAVVKGAGNNAAMTVLAGCDRLYKEAGQHIGNVSNRETFLRSMGWLVTFFGADTRLVDIDDNWITKAVAKRRGEANQKIMTGTPRLVSADTVDITMTKRLRQLLLRARDMWGVPVRSIKWSRHFIGQDKERVREASLGEEAALMAALDPDFAAIVRFCFLSGARRAEACGLVWTRVDWFGRRFTLLGKGNKERTLPMDQAIHDLLWPLRSHHPEFVFTYVAAHNKRMPDGRRLVAGERYPISAMYLKTAHKVAADKAGLVNWRQHDARHTFATRTLRVSNLRVVQTALGHSDPKVTAKYAHVMDDDLLKAMEASRHAASDAQSPAKSPAKAWPKAAND